MLVARLIIIAMLFSTPAFCYAQDKTDDLIRYRQSVMMTMRWNIGIIKQQLKQPPAEYDRRQLKAAADVLAAIAASDIKSLFPPGSETGKGWVKTRARDELFEQRDKFNEYLEGLGIETAKFAALIADNRIEQLDEDYDRMFQVCRSCHKKYRSKDR